MLLVDHPAAHDLLKDDHFGSLAIDRRDDLVEGGNLSRVEALVDVVGHKREGRPRRLRVRCHGSADQSEERHSDNDRRERGGQRRAQADDRARREQGREGNECGRHPHRRL